MYTILTNHVRVSQSSKESNWDNRCPHWIDMIHAIIMMILRDTTISGTFCAIPFVRLLTWDIHSSLHHHSSMDSWMTAVWCHLSTMKSTLHIPDSLRKSGSTTWRTETGSGRAGWDAMRLRQLVRSWSC